MLLQIAKLGHPILRRIAEPLTLDELHDPDISRLIDDMIATMRDHEGIGLAAPQVFVTKRILIVELRPSPRTPGTPSLPLKVMLNPEITIRSADTIPVWEGCLSVDNLRGLVRRPSAITVHYSDRQGDERTLDLDGLAAVIVQHEMDHLDGQLFLDRMDDMTRLAHQREFERFWQTALPQLVD